MNGAGNLANLLDGYRTEYLYREVLSTDSLLDIIQRSMRVEYDPDTKAIKKIIFRTTISWMWCASSSRTHARRVLGRVTSSSIRRAQESQTLSRGWHIVCSLSTMLKTTQCSTPL